MRIPGAAGVVDRYPSGVLDTCTYIDVGQIRVDDLPDVPELTAITVAELHQGVALARDEVARSARMEKLTAAIRDFDPLPFDGDAAARYGTLVALTRSSGRDPWPRRMGPADRRRGVRAWVAALHRQPGRLPWTGKRSDRGAGLPGRHDLNPLTPGHGRSSAARTASASAVSCAGSR